MTSPRRREDTTETPETPAQADQPAADVAAQPDQPGEQPRDAAGRFASPPDPTTDPRVQALIEAARKEAAKEATAKAKEAAKAEAEKAAERAKMDEVARLQAEKADAEKMAQEAKAEAAKALEQAEFSLALVSAGVQLAGPEASDLIRFAAMKRREADPKVTVAQAVAAAIEANPYLVKQVQQDASQPTPSANPGLHTGPAVVSPGAPASRKPTPPVDVFSMSDADYQAYKRATHGTN
jgi:hypothetical protein